MGLLNEIQEEAISRNSDAASLLRKCLLLAARVDSELLEDWVKYELNGYPKDAEIPNYRELALTFRGHFVGFNSELKNMPIPSYIIERIVGDNRFNPFKVRQSIITINDVDEASGIINLDNFASLLGGKVYQEYNAISVWGEVPSLKGIIGSVINRVLEFTLAIEKKYPNAGEVDGMNKKDQHLRDNVKEIVSNTIYSNVGFVGNANHSTVNIVINSGNIEMLKEYLGQQGVDQADLRELEAAIQLEPEIGNDKKFGPKVASWIAKMVDKAASGAWEVGVGASSSILATALLQYYGFN